MENLIEILKKETESLKIQYMEMTAKWAAAEFTRLKEWVERYRKGEFGYSQSSRIYDRLPYTIVNPNGKVEVYVEGLVQAAAVHYENSILKLADRIEKKGLNPQNITVKTAHVGVNITTTLTDGQKTVRAWTIIASGEIQRPHYRYLIK